ncbi:MAG: hypothetical protein WD672_04510 [Woeseia sp.]
MRLLAKNAVLGLALVAPPILAEVVATFREQAPGAGVNLLLYFPVDFGLIACALAAFMCLNAYELRQRPAGILLGAFAGLPVAAVWFGFAFLVVFQVHLWRGGQM